MISQLPAIICTIGAILVYQDGSDGWGWFLFAAVLLCSTPKYRGSKSEE
jgi:hypothetical protein